LVYILLNERTNIVLLAGCAISMKCTVLADVIGNQKLCTGFGMIMFAAGFTVFLGPSLAGAFF